MQFCIDHNPFVIHAKSPNGLIVSDKNTEFRKDEGTTLFYSESFLHFKTLQLGSNYNLSVVDNLSVVNNVQGNGAPQGVYLSKQIYSMKPLETR